MKRLAERDLACPEGRVLLHGRQPRPIVRLPSVRLRPPWQPHRQSREDQTASLTLHPNPPRASHTKPATTARRSGCSRCPAPDRPAAPPAPSPPPPDATTFGGCKTVLGAAVQPFLPVNVPQIPPRAGCDRPPAPCARKRLATLKPALKVRPQLLVLAAVLMRCPSHLADLHTSGGENSRLRGTRERRKDGGPPPCVFSAISLPRGGGSDTRSRRPSVGSSD
jgi:hypothetical protein